MIGSNKNEGLMWTAMLVGEEAEKDVFRSNWTQCMITNILGVPRANTQEKHLETLNELLEFYGIKPGLVDDAENMVATTKAFTDAAFAFPAELVARPLVENAERKSSTWFYRFDHLGAYSLSDMFSGGPIGTPVGILQNALGLFTSKEMGTCHADDLIYLFSMKIPLSTLRGPADLDMSRLMVDLWANFAEYRNPTPRLGGQGFAGESLSGLTEPWRPAELLADGSLYEVVLKNGQMSQWRDAGEQARMRFWRERQYLVKNSK